LAAVGVGAHSAKKMAPPILKSASLLEENLPANTLWVLGSSTGGTQALTHILRCCPSRIPPILITQHIPPIFSKAFADSLNDLCPFTVKEAEDGDAVESGCVYIAPGDFQMKIIQGGGKLRIRIVDEPKVNRFKPSVDYMFDSLAKITGHNIVAGVLTGMGKDGAAGLLKLREAGAKTFAQDEESSIVYGMPKAAFDMGGASTQVALSRVAEELVRLSGLRLGKKVA